MKKYLIIAFLFSATGLTYCSTSKKAAAPKVISYTEHIAPLMVAQCGPCHFPDRGGKKLPLNTYSSIADNIDDIINRIEMQPGQKGFMPRKRDRLSDSTIQMVKDWKAGGMVK